MHNRAPAGYVCPFCLIIQGVQHGSILTRESDVVYRGEQATAFIGSHQWPNNPGNTIVVPNEHFENLYDLPARLAPPIHELVQAIAMAMKAAFGCDGVSTRQHNEPGGNQEIWHYHLHVTPRYFDDGFYGSERALMPVEERGRYAAVLRNHLRS